jgi:hypothetical protein
MVVSEFMVATILFLKGLSEVEHIDLAEAPPKDPP